MKRRQMPIENLSILIGLETVIQTFQNLQSLKKKDTSQVQKKFLYRLQLQQMKITNMLFPIQQFKKRKQHLFTKTKMVMLSKQKVTRQSLKQVKVETNLQKQMKSLRKSKKLKTKDMNQFLIHIQQMEYSIKMLILTKSTQ